MRVLSEQIDIQVGFVIPLLHLTDTKADSVSVKISWQNPDEWSVQGQHNGQRSCLNDPRSVKLPTVLSADDLVI